MTTENPDTSMKHVILVSFLTGVISSAIVGIFIHIYTKAERDPVFLVDPDRAVILSSKDIEDTTIKVIKNDSTVITSDLTAIRFYFWNRGNQSIRFSDVLKGNLSLNFTDKNIDILSYRILNQSRDIVDFQVNRNVDNPHNQLDLQFEILEKNDGITGQIIYEGDPMTSLTIQGEIEGSSIKKYLERDPYQIYIIVPITLLITLLLFMILNKVLKPINDKVSNKMDSFFENRLSDIPRKILNIIFADTALISMLIAFTIILGASFYLVKSGVVMGNLDIQIPDTVRP